MACWAQTSVHWVSSVSGPILYGTYANSSSAAPTARGLRSSSRVDGFHFLLHSAEKKTVDRSVKRLCPCLLAKRKFSGAELNAEDDLDEDMRTGLNEVTTEALKAMLAEDDKLVEQFREKVDYLGEYLVQEGQLDAARFMLVVRSMLDHEVCPQKDDLKGPYKKAFDKIAALIEDSGWVLKHEGQDVGGWKWWMMS